MDNTAPLNYDELKSKTFKDIFTSVNNNGAISIKKSLNYANYTKEDYDIISKK